LALAPPYHVVQCGGCGIRYLTPQPDADQLYEADYWSGAEQVSRMVAAKVADFTALYQRLETYTTGRRLLEIGSATGHFLKVGRERGWRVEGIELSRWAAGYCRDTFGIPVRVERIEQASLPTAAYDAVMISHVL
jgi:cyclopropane fatty-acyl-phospholipid synthase-like methyltransferase